MTTKRVPRPVLWLAALGLLLMLNACGSDPNAEAIANDKATMAAMATSIAAEQAEEPAATDTPPPTATPAPTDTPAPTSTPTAPPPTSTLAVKESAGDSLTITQPTATPVPEGIIVFLSSRDHPRTEEEIRDHSGAHDLELYAMHPDGSQQIRLSDGTLGLSNYSSYLHLTPYFIDGQIVIQNTIVFDLKDRRVVEKLVPTQKINGRILKFFDGSFGDFVANRPVWSQAGELAFSPGGPYDLGLYYLESIDSYTIQRLTVAPDKSAGEYYPAWSPDGQQIVFSRRWNDKNQDGLWIISKDGSELRRVVASDHVANGIHQPNWSPDGKTIAYEGPKENTQHFTFELWTVDIAGKNPRQLTHLPEMWNIWGPVWSPDSRQISFTMAPGGMVGSQSNIYTIGADGGEPRQLTFEGYTNLIPLWLPLDADEILAGGDTPLQEPPTPTPRPQAPAPQPAKATNCPSPGVEISSPAAGTRFTQRNNFIVGTANIPRFHHWRIEYSTDPNGGWSYLLERDYPVDNDKLVMIDASTIPNGPYGLRLTVVDETGNYPEPCEVWFTNGY